MNTETQAGTTRRDFLTGGAAALLLAGCSRPDAKADTTLRIGMDLTYRPFGFVDTAGKPTGVEVEMAEALAKELGRPLKIESMEFQGLLPALQTNRIDLILSSMTANEERRQAIAFSEPYARTALALLVAKNSPVQSLADLKQPGRKVVVRLTTTGELFAKTQLPGTPRIELKQDSECVQEVKQGKVDAWIYDQLSVWEYNKENPADTRALLQPVKEEEWAIGLRKTDTALKEQVDAFIAKFRKDGGFEKLGDKYLGEQKRVLKEMGIPFILR